MRRRIIPVKLEEGNAARILAIATTGRPVVITGIGYIAAGTLQQALAGAAVQPPDPPPEITAFEVPEGQPAWGFEALDFSLERELPHIKSFVDRTSALALAAGRHALADAGLPTDRSPGPSGEIGCAYGTLLGCLESMAIFWNKVKSTNPKFAQPLAFTHGYANSPSSLLCIEYGLRGPAATFSGDRLAGVQALLFAFDQIAAGAGEIILAGASESLTPPAYHHLLASGQVSRSGAPGEGLIPGEGAAMLALESAESARRRGARIYAEVSRVEMTGELAGRPAAGGGAALSFCSAHKLPPSGTWLKPGQDGRTSVSLQYFSGDTLSVAPILDACIAAGVLNGRLALPQPAGAARRAFITTQNPGSCIELNGAA